MIRQQAAVIVANTVAAQLAKAATTTVPIVFATGGDPVGENLVASFNRPGRNITGVSFPRIQSRGEEAGTDPRSGAQGEDYWRAREPEQSNQPDGTDGRADRSARGRTASHCVLRASTEDDFEIAFATLVRERAGALLVTGDALFNSRRDRLIALAGRHAVPTIHSEKPFVEAGGLMSYGANIAEAYRQVGVYTGRILKGERPADLPVMQPTKFELVINLKTAKALGLTIPQSVLMRADQVIE